LPKIFDPFFTTKPPDKGTGLGLSISLRIIEIFNGQIRAESQVGKGSTFTILLPFSEGAKISNPQIEEKS
jgi:signal transduction histidine kinase